MLHSKPRVPCRALRPMPPAAGVRAGRAAALAAALGLAVAIGPGGAPADAAERLAGPVAADLVGVVDGDTVDVRAHIWLGQTVETRVRLDGIDTPESRGGCEAETEAAALAAQRLADLLGAGPVVLTDIRYGTWAGRVVARVTAPDGTDVADALVAEGLAAVYDGRGGRPDWCERLAARQGD